jgi:hypothetical protein
MVKAKNSFVRSFGMGLIVIGSVSWVFGLVNLLVWSFTRPDDYSTTGTVTWVAGFALLALGGFLASKANENSPG